MVKDVLGNFIEPGDIIIRSRNSVLQKREVVRVTTNTVQVKREKRYDYYSMEEKPLTIKVWRGEARNIINLSKTTTDEMFNHEW